MSARRPPRLRAGDTVALVAPCSPTPEEELAAALPVIEAWGARPQVRPHTRDRHPVLGYLAGTDADRAADLQEALLAPDVAAVVCVRGGDGAHRTLDLLDYGALRGAPPKAFVGFSDVTALHAAFAEELDLVTFHGPGAGYFGRDPAAAEELRTTLFEPESRVRIAPPGARPLIGGTARGRLMGGNLSILADSLATPHFRASAEGGLLLLEDVGEDVSRLDRMLTQLLRSGWMNGAAGVLLGSWGKCTPDEETIRAMMRERLAPLGVPVADGFGFGHIPAQTTVPLGMTATLDADAGTLVLDEPALV
ncbi:S66 peptidase family protein [Nocardiopsis chromatogenes]|uniref:S66 peptidase family protein n=1 Tax=Nocardiopsis chromatogenes TaxID=280239 RepID=UPI000345ADEB|nr:LD-carboxypeptidase [Nocardiopsis chromatogenes]